MNTFSGPGEPNTYTPAGATFATTFGGKNPNASWNLIMNDTAGGQKGTMYDWKLIVTYCHTCGDSQLDSGEGCDDGN